MSRKIGWGKYGGYEGPVYWGSRKYSADLDSSLYEKAVSLTSAAEGNCDAVNMYDRAICSVGSIQWIELGQFNVSNMIGKLVEDLGEDYVLSRLEAPLFQSKAEFKQTPAGDWRFHMKSTSGTAIPVNNEAAARFLFLGCSGREGTWTPGARSKAELWCASIASLFETPEAAASQAEFTVSKLEKSFIWKNARQLFLPAVPDVLTYEESRWRDVVIAYYISFAVNLPAKADSVLKNFLAVTKQKKWSKEWSVELIHKLTFSVSHWPGRYDAQIGEAARLFFVKFPKSSQFRTNPMSVVAAFPPEPQPIEAPTEAVKEQSEEIGAEQLPQSEQAEVSIPPTEEVVPFQKQEINKGAIAIPVLMMIAGFFHTVLQSGFVQWIKEVFSKIYHFFL